MGKDDKSRTIALGISLGLAIGAGAGVAICSAVGNLGAGIAIGIGVSRHRPTAKGSDQTTSPRNLYLSGSSQTSSLSAGFTWESPPTIERIRRSLCALPPDDNNGSTRRCSPTNLSVPLVRAAEREMRASIRGVAPTQPPDTANRSLSSPKGVSKRPSAENGFDTASPTQPTEDADETRSLSRPSGRIETPIRGTETTTTIFRGPHGKTFALTNQYKPEKRHSWLDIKE